MNKMIQDSFDKVKASEELKASTMDFLDKKRNSNSRARMKKVAFPLVAAVCLCLCLFVGINQYNVANTPISYVSIDINPSIELSLNKNDVVIDSQYYNEDGKKVLENIDVEGIKYDEAIDKIVESDTLQSYISDSSELIFTVASENNSKKKELSDSISNCNTTKKYKARCYEADAEEITEAHNHGLSFGKYSAYLELSKYLPDITPEDCKSMTMSEIRRTIRNCHNDNSSSDKDSGQCNKQNNTDMQGTGNGQGANNGSGNQYKHHNNQNQ